MSCRFSAGRSVWAHRERSCGGRCGTGGTACKSRRNGGGGRGRKQTTPISKHSEDQNMTKRHKTWGKSKAARRSTGSSTHTETRWTRYGEGEEQALQKMCTRLLRREEGPTFRRMGECGSPKGTVQDFFMAMWRTEQTERRGLFNLKTCVKNIFKHVSNVNAVYFSCASTRWHLPLSTLEEKT